MESGQGMVAIVQGSKHAGLTVTVLPDKHRSCKRKYVVLDMGVTATRGCKSNVETNTEWVSRNCIPPWDVRYDSGYQFANCLRPPSSPRRNEFLGNGSGEMESSSATRQDGFMYRGRSSHHSPPHHMVSFMQSLRQYPNVSSSADLIQRLLDCAYIRNPDTRDFGCVECHSHGPWEKEFPWATGTPSFSDTKKPSKRSLLRKSTSSHTHRVGKKPDNSQTHKINRNSGRLDRSASVIGKRCSSQEELLNYTYDYLKSSSLIRRRTDVRYLTEMKRALKDRLREIIECRPTVCPKIQSRYIIHKRNHNCGSPKHTSVATNNTETQVRLPESRAVPNLAYESSYTSPKCTLHKACFCQPTPCVCPKSHDVKILNEIKDWIKDIPVFPNFSEEDKIRQDELLKGLENTLKDLLQESHFNFKAKKEILKSLNALPMWHPNDPKEDVLFKEKLADSLIEKLGNAAETIFEEEIANEIEKLPLDYEHINKDDIKRITEKFANRLKLIVFNRPPDEEEYKAALKSELLDLLEDVPLKYESQKPEVKSEIAEKFSNKLRTIKLPASKQITTKQQERDIEKKVNDIYKDIPELSDLSASDNKELTQFLKAKMDEYGPNDLEDSEVKQEVQREIKDWLDNSAISERIDSKTKDKLTKKIMQELRESNLKSNDEDTFGFINKWVQDIPELSGGDIIENKKALQDLAAQLDEILTSGEDPENIQVDIRETITDWLQNRLRKNHRRLSFTTQENLVNELVKKLNNAPKKTRHMQRKSPDIYGDVVEWIKDIPGIDSNINDDQSTAIEDLMNALNDISNNSDEEDVETQTRDAINNFIDHLSNNTGVKILPKQRKLLEKKLLDKMKQAPQQRKRWNKLDGFGSSTPKSYASGRYSMSGDMSRDMSPIRNISVSDRQGKVDEYMNILNNLIESWIKRLELSIDSAEQKNLVSDIATDVVDRQKYLQISDNKTTGADELEHLKYQIFRRLNKFNLEDLPRIISQVSDLNKALVTVKVPELIKPLNRSDDTRNINKLVNSLKTWVDNIPPDLASSYNKPYSDEVFIDLAKNLAGPEDTINHYHVKNEILQWLPKLFNNLSTHTLNSLADSLKNHLMNDLAHSLTQDKTAGLMYRQMLWDTISKTLPSIHMTSADDLHAFDLLKERLVDAFINLHYFADDMVARDKFRTKLFNEVNKFCNEYLSRYPDTPMNSEEISKNLYNALRKVSVPNIETVRSELEQVRLKEEILDWLPNLSIDTSKNMDPEINVMASGLAKRLHGLEKEKHRDPNKDNEMKQEIAKWLNKLPLKNKEQINLQDFADNLMDKIKSTDKSRTLSVSKIGKYYDNITQARRSFQYPQSNLNVEDRAHLDRIRRRLEYSRGYRTRCLCRDASVSPPPRESGIQTEMDGRFEGSVQTRPSMYERCDMINRGVSPQVIIKEYYWDSTGSNMSVRERTTDALRPCSPCSPCSKVAQTTPQLIRTCQRTKDAQTEQLNNTYPRSQVDKICDKRSCSLGTLADINPCTPPPCYYPEERRTYQRINLPSEVIGSRRKVDTCCNCGQRIYTKCRGRHSGYRPHCNLTCLKYCPNCGNGCPYPSNLYFRKEF